MKVLGLIVEYNPFHNGHLYHLEQSRKLSGADYVVCIMSGNFIQRGEPAIINKWARAEAALKAGIDLIIELPTVYAMSSAEFFAFGAVKILDSLGIVDSICFGSESGQIYELDIIAEILANEPLEYKLLLKDELNKGLSYPTARETAITQYLATALCCRTVDLSLLSSSNNILGIEYLKALKKLNSSIKPLTIQRINNAYNNREITGTISSATSIRTHISKNRPLLPQNTMPEYSSKVLEEEFANGRGPVSAKNYEDILLSSFRGMRKESIKSLPYVAEGLENRICNSAKESGSLEEMMESVCTKRYTRTRIQRILFSALTSLTANEFETFNAFGGPQYIKVLGFNQNGPVLLSQINKNATLPVIIKAADFKNSCNPLLRRMLEIEAFSTDMYVLGYNNPLYRKAGQEYTQNIIISP